MVSFQSEIHDRTALELELTYLREEHWEQVLSNNHEEHCGGQRIRESDEEST